MMCFIFIPQNAVVLADVAALIAGIEGAVVLSVFSTELDGTFRAPRTLPATAVLFSEPDPIVPRTSISRRSSTDSSDGPPPSFCPMPIIPTHAIIHGLKSSAQRVYERTIPGGLRKRFETIYRKGAVVYSKFSLIKAKAWQDAQLGCLIPYLTQPFQPVLQYVRCKIGLDDGFMEAPSNCTMCTDPSQEDRTITNDLNVPNIQDEMNVRTLSDCDPSMPTISYGVRTIIKIIDDEDCENPKNQELCLEIEKEGRIIDEDACEMPRYKPIHIHKQK